MRFVAEPVEPRDDLGERESGVAVEAVGIAEQPQPGAAVAGRESPLGRLPVRAADALPPARVSSLRP